MKTFEIPIDEFQLAKMKARLDSLVGNPLNALTFPPAPGDSSVVPSSIEHPAPKLVSAATVETIGRGVELVRVLTVWAYLAQRAAVALATAVARGTGIKVLISGSYSYFIIKSLATP